MLFHFWMFMTPTHCVLLSMKWLFFCVSLTLWIHCSSTFSLFAAAAAICCSVPWQWLFLHLSLPPSVSILLFHCLFTSLHRPCSITLSPLATSYSVFTLPPSLSLILSTGNNSLSSLSSPLPSPLSCRVHQIHSALSGTMATRKLL